MISDQTIQAVASGVTLSEIARGYFPVKRRGSQFWGCCPFHAERTASFCLNDEKGMYKCWGCGKGGNIFRFVMEMDRITFPEAVRKLGAIAGVAVEEEETPQGKLVKAMLSANFKANEFFFRSLLSPSGAEARRQLKARGFTKELCEAWGIGFAPDQYTFDGDGASACGLVYDNGSPRFKNRIMFAIRNESGSIVGFSGRAISAHPAKYLNSPDSPIFNKGKLLFGLDKAKKDIMDKGEVVIVEGQIDAIRCHLSGVTNTVAPLGTAFTELQASTIKRLCGSAVLTLDGDQAGQEAARKAFALLSAVGVEVKSVNLPVGKDPDDFIVEGGNLFAEVAKALPYPEALAKALPHDTAGDKLVAARKVGFALSRLPDNVVRDSTATKLAKVIGVKIGELRKYVATAGGHAAIATREIAPIKSEGVRHLIYHLLYCGKNQAARFDWSLVGEPTVIQIMEMDYEAGNPASIANVLGQLDASVESSIQGVIKEDALELDIKGVYRGLLELAARSKAEEVATGKSSDSLIPILSALKQLDNSDGYIPPTG